MFNPVAPYRYMLHNLCLSVADIANSDLFACGSRTWISIDIARFYEERCQPSHYWERKGSTQFAPGSLDRCDSYIACRMCCLEP